MYSVCMRVRAHGARIGTLDPQNSFLPEHLPRYPAFFRNASQLVAVRIFFLMLRKGTILLFYF